MRHVVLPHLIVMVLLILPMACATDQHPAPLRAQPLSTKNTENHTVQAEACPRPSRKEPEPEPPPHMLPRADYWRHMLIGPPDRPLPWASAQLKQPNPPADVYLYRADGCRNRVSVQAACQCVVETLPPHAQPAPVAQHTRQGLHPAPPMTMADACRDPRTDPVPDCARRLTPTALHDRHMAQSRRPPPLPDAPPRLATWSIRLVAGL
jgi:hypothetical protein